MARFFAKLLLKASRLFDEPKLNSSLCLIFNGMASMIAIVFLVFFIIKKTGPLMGLGWSGCFCMILANTTDLFPLLLSTLAKKLDKRIAVNGHERNE